MANEYKLPLPNKQPESDYYWEKAKAHELWLRKCNDCGNAYFYPRDICPNCYSDNVTWVQASGKATLHAYSIVANFHHNLAVNNHRLYIRPLGPVNKGVSHMDIGREIGLGHCLQVNKDNVSNPARFEFSDMLSPQRSLGPIYGRHTNDIVRVDPGRCRTGQAVQFRDHTHLLNHVVVIVDRSAVGPNTNIHAALFHERYRRNPAPQAKI